MVLSLLVSQKLGILDAKENSADLSVSESFSNLGRSCRLSTGRTR
jgi:hypothetical protein